MISLQALAADLAARAPALAQDARLNSAAVIEGLIWSALSEQMDRVPKRVYVFINGILTFPGDAKNWNGRAVTWANTLPAERFAGRSLRLRAEKVEYWAGPIDRVFGQLRRARKLCEVLRHYDGWEIVLVGHSNGADVIVDMLRHYACPPIGHLHLVCGATEGDFGKNGLNCAMMLGRVGEVTVYCAGRDWTLKLAHTLPGRLLGYGTMGLTGPLNVLPGIGARVRTVRWPGYAHSDCWKELNFNSIMAAFL